MSQRPGLRGVLFLLLALALVAANPSAAAAAYPSETGLGIYRGVVIGQFDTADVIQEIACDFGSAGVWVFHGNAWDQITGVNPDWIIGLAGDSAAEKMIGDFGALGLWMWSHSGYPGTWTQLSGLDASWAFGVEDDAHTGDEVYVNFGVNGLWRRDSYGLWTLVSALSPSHGLRTDMNLFLLGEEACLVFPSAGLWATFNPWTQLSYYQLTGMMTAEDDHAAARFLNYTGQELVTDFGGLGLWLRDTEYSGGWHQISSDSWDRIKVAKFGPLGPGLIMKSDTRTGLFHWRFDGSFPGVERQLTAMPIDTFGFCEPFSYTPGDDDDELAVDAGSGGLWKHEYYSYYGDTWIQLSGVDPVFMVAGDLWGEGHNSALVADFGATGLWLYHSTDHSWRQLSALSPDDSDAL